MTVSVTYHVCLCAGPSRLTTQWREEDEEEAAREQRQRERERQLQDQDKDEDEGGHSLEQPGQQTL